LPEHNEGEQLRCLACGERLPAHPAFAALDRLHGSPGRFAVAVCGECGSGTTLPVVGDAELDAYYPQSYGPHLDPELSPVVGMVSRAMRAWLSWRALRGFPIAEIVARRPGAGIDVGCGTGDLAAALIARGWQMSGIEPSAPAAERARERGVDVHTGTVADAKLEPQSLDVAVLQQSLEHTVDALNDLIRLREALRPAGLIVISVPNFGCWQSRRLRSRWFHLDVPRHRAHFTPQGLRRLLLRAGFEAPDIRTSTSDVGLPGSMQYVLAGRCLFPSGLKLRVASGLSALTWPLAVLANRVGGGGDVLHALAFAPA
jgi:SAM-dependent methyltransferase